MFRMRDLCPLRFDTGNAPQIAPASGFDLRGRAFFSFPASPPFAKSAILGASGNQLSNGVEIGKIIVRRKIRPWCSHRESLRFSKISRG
jgi:hypothetical protein